MATEFNPGGPVRRDESARTSLNPPTTHAAERSSWGMIAAGALVAILVIVGLMFFIRDTNDTASTNAPGTTTGAAPSPSNPPPAPGPQQNQGQGTSTR